MPSTVGWGERELAQALGSQMPSSYSLGLSMAELEAEVGLYFGGLG